MVLHDTYIHTNDRMREKTEEHTNIITIGRETIIIAPWSRIDQLLNIISTDNQMRENKANRMRILKKRIRTNHTLLCIVVWSEEEREQ